MDVNSDHETDAGNVDEEVFNVSGYSEAKSKLKVYKQIETISHTAPSAEDSAHHVDVLSTPHLAV